MNLDIRLPIGLLLAIYGLLLSSYGALQDSLPAVLGAVNADVAWGVVLLLAGIAMCGAALRARSRRRE